MREHIRRLIDEAYRAEDAKGLGGATDPALRLASETIRLARLAASTHMILSARQVAAAEKRHSEPVAARGDAP